VRCSFCNKPEDQVGIMAASPDSLPRAYICDECIRLCGRLLEDKKLVGHPVLVHPLLAHPRTADLLDAIVAWVRHPGEAELGRVREIAQAVVPRP
jgi:hypothetical protein